EICNAVLPKKPALISSVVRPFLHLVIRHHLRNELLIEHLPHRAFKNIHHNIRTAGSSHLKQREPRVRGGPISYFRIYPKLRLLPPFSNGGPEFFRFSYLLVRNHLYHPTMRKVETAGMNLHSNVPACFCRRRGAGRSRWRRSRAAWAAL